MTAPDKDRWHPAAARVLGELSLAMTLGRTSLRDLRRWGRVLVRVGQEMQATADLTEAKLADERAPTPRRRSRREP